MKDTGLIIIGLIAILVLLAIDFIALPLVLKMILGWGGLDFSFLQCLIILIFFNVITYSFRKKG